MFTTSLENNFTRPNERGEYDVAEGLTASLFRSILVSYFSPTSSQPNLLSLIIGDVSVGAGLLPNWHRVLSALCKCV